MLDSAQHSTTLHSVDVCKKFEISGSTLPFDLKVRDRSLENLGKGMDQAGRKNGKPEILKAVEFKSNGQKRIQASTDALPEK